MLLRKGDRVRVEARGDPNNGKEGTLLQDFVGHLQFDTACVMFDDGQRRNKYAWKLKLIDDAASHIPEDWS